MNNRAYDIFLVGGRGHGRYVRTVPNEVTSIHLPVGNKVRIGVDNELLIRPEDISYSTQVYVLQRFKIDELQEPIMFYVWDELKACQATAAALDVLEGGWRRCLTDN